MTFISSILAFFTGVWNFLVKNKTGVLVLLIGFLIFFNVLQRRTIANQKTELAAAHQNENALKDTIRITKDKAGKREADILAFYVPKTKDLAKLNADLAKEVEETKGKVAELTKAGIQIKQVHDTIKLAANVDSSSDSEFVRVNFNYDTTFSPGNYRQIQGYTKYEFKTKAIDGALLKDVIGVNFVTGIKNLDKGKPEIFLRSDYPGFTVTSLEGAVLDPNMFKKNKTPLFTIGLNVGLVPYTYDFSKKVSEWNINRIGVSAGLNINLLRLFNK